MGILIVGGLFGYAAMYITGAYIRKQYRRKFCGKFEQEINTDDFLLFLNTCPLRYLRSTFMAKHTLTILSIHLAVFYSH